MLKLFSFLLIFLSIDAYSKHIVGGEIYYQCLGNNNYQITLKVYRDCLSAGAPYDDPAVIGVYDINGNLKDSVLMDFPGATVLPSSINSLCSTAPTNVCVEEAIYTQTLHLTPLPGGYILSYQRCCRNSTILNLANVGNTGSTYTAQIPDQNIVCNSSPYFNKFPPIFLCANSALNFDHSATDPDGDSLVYGLCDPFDGADSLGPKPSPINFPPPYKFVRFRNPYNGGNPMSGNPALTIDSKTGLLTGTPNMIGQWVVGVCVREFRNGVLISTNKRDFQFNVLNCPDITVSSIVSQQTFCFGYEVNFLNNSVNATSYLWNFGDTKVNDDTSNAVTPTYTYSDSGTYRVSLICNPNTPCADTGVTDFYIYPLLNPSFEAPPDQCFGGNTFSFTSGGSIAGTSTEYLWNFGTDATPTASNARDPVNITFNKPGTFPITLTVTENTCVKSFTDSINVFERAKADFTPIPQMGCAPLTAQFIDSGAFMGAATKYLWNFGDGAISSDTKPIHIYSGAGNYGITLTVITSNGCVDTVSFFKPNLIVVYPSPIAGFTAEPSSTSISNPEISITDKSINKETFYFTLGDGTTSNLNNFRHIYKDTGVYIIKQIVGNEFGCMDSINGTIRINPEYKFWIPNTFTPNEDGLNDVFLPVQMGMKGFDMEIFNRWGESIFQSIQSQGWDGTVKGGKNKGEDGIYIYKIDLNDFANEKFSFTGKVTLLR